MTANPVPNPTPPLRRTKKAFGWKLESFVFLYLAVFVGLPLIASLIQLARVPLARSWQVVSSDQAISAFKLSTLSASIASFINAIMGFILAWVLVRYRFPLRSIVDTLVDLPLAMPAVVAGISFLTLYGPSSLIGSWFAESGPIGAPLAKLGITGIQITGTLGGLVFVNMFVTLPFVVRTVQPSILELDRESEEAAATLGATANQTYWRVILPTVLPAIVAGFGLAFVRAINEYGIATMVSGNIPYESQVATVYIASRLEAFDAPGATAVAAVQLLICFVVLILTYLWQYWSTRHAR
jgi:sulfate/thiosulfate transport system permease protein